MQESCLPLNTALSVSAFLGGFHLFSLRSCIAGVCTLEFLPMWEHCGRISAGYFLHITAMPLHWQKGVILYIMQLLLSP